MKLHPLAAAIAALMVCAAPLAQASTSGVVISQFYGGGGNSGATLKNDFVELYNAGTSAVSLAGWSLQYNSSTGTGTWQVTTLPAVTLQPGQYFLVQEAQGSGGTDSLPTPDATGTIAMSASSGKVALLNSTVALSGATPSSSALVDLVGFGSANWFEGAVATAPSNTSALLRAASGCTDSDNNANDFATGTPAPRNSASPLGTCGAAPGPVAATIPQIQGRTGTSPLLGQSVRTSGVVTLVMENGFFMQDPAGDGDEATSDGVFVYTRTTPTVTTGDGVQLTATVTEYNVGASNNADTAAHTVTELTGPTALSVLSSGNTITPLVVTLPEAVNDDLERYEGMLVTLQGPLTVSQNYFQGRYGEVTLSVGGRMETPTNRYRPGSDEALALADENARRRIILDDSSSLQNPNPTPFIGVDNTLRAGDTTTSVTGVVDYGLATSSNTGAGDYKIQALEPVIFSRDNARTEAPVTVGGNLKVASFNVLNFFTTFTDGSTADGQSGQGCSLDGSVSAGNCRGASNIAEFTRQRDKIVAAIAAIDADALGLMEMQNNGATAVQNLVDALNAKVGPGTYAIVPDPAAGTGSDAIKVAMIYKPARLSRVGEAQSDTDPVNNRPPLAQTFAALNGQRFTLVVNHLKSKGSCPSAGDSDYAGNFDSGDGQGCWNALRVQQAERLSTWVGTLADAAGTSDAVLLGDFNSYAQEDPVATLTSSGFVDQIGRYNSFGYSYVFDGASGRLDHGFATASLSGKVTDAVEWHINADEPSVIDYNLEYKQPACATCGPDYYTATAYRSSDHDPMVMALSLLNTITGTGKRDTLVGTPGDDLFIAGGKADTLTGGTGRDEFRLTALGDARDTITDFTPGEDVLDLRALLSSIGYTGSDPIGDRVVQLRNHADGVHVQVYNPNSGKYKVVAALIGLVSSQIDPARDLWLVDAPALKAGKRSRASVH
ncbi:ExeM/NucH family extracellular endonuclease [Ideonella dechloratans]|uniref:ExeM/NucH family extracellular endonuclease n=1 Tax=Ideonella dechloratans TaxID=36863 RepID=UPI0035AF9EA1